MLTFAQMEQALATHLEVRADHRAALRARLKQLQRLGVPQGVNNKHEQRVRYTAAQLLEVVMVLELLRCGLTPERSTRQVATWWDWVRRAFLIARGHAYPVSIAFLQADFLWRDQVSGGRSSVTSDEDDGCLIVGLDPNDTDEMARETLAVLTRSRTIIVNMTAILEGLTRGLRLAGAESVFVWAETEAWKEDWDLLGRSLDPKEI